MKATYVSVFDDSIVCESECEFDPLLCLVTDIQLAENNDDAEHANALTDEYVIDANGQKWDGVLLTIKY